MCYALHTMSYTQVGAGGGHPLQFKEKVGHVLCLEKEVVMVPIRFSRRMNWSSFLFGVGCSHPMHFEEEAAMACTEEVATPPTLRRR